MNLQAGMRIFIPCEVKPGPFGNERLVRIHWQGGLWVGIVDSSLLRDPSVETGKSAVLAVVSRVSSDKFVARIPGHQLGHTPFRGRGEFEGPISQVTPVGAV